MKNSQSSKISSFHIIIPFSISSWQEIYEMLRRGWILSFLLLGERWEGEEEVGYLRTNKLILNTVCISFFSLNSVIIILVYQIMSEWPPKHPHNFFWFRANKFLKAVIRSPKTFFAIKASHISFLRMKSMLLKNPRTIHMFLPFSHSFSVMLIRMNAWPWLPS